MSDRWIPAREEYYVQTGGMHENPFGVPIDEIVRMVVENPPRSAPRSSSASTSSRPASSSARRRSTSSGTDPRARPRQLLRGPPRRRGGAAFSARYDDHGSPFHTGVDVARQTDWTVITTLDCRTKPARLVYWKRLQRVPWETIYGEIGRARSIFGPNILVDSSGPGGDVVMDSLESRWFCPHHRETFLIGSRCPRYGAGPQNECKPHHYLALSCCEGYHFTGTTKKELVEHLRNVTEVGYSSTEPSRDFGWIRSPPIPELEEELAFYTWDDKKLTTDSLFSLALAAWSGLEDPIEDPAYGSVYGI
jgi:hypothetical protein